MINIPASLTKDEIDILIRKCNFTLNESMLLTYRSSGKTLEECAELMNYSTRTISTLNRKLNNKIQRISLL